MRKAVSREIGRGQEDSAEGFYWIDVNLIGVVVVGHQFGEGIYWVGNIPWL